MRKLLTIIAMMIMCNAYGEEVVWFNDNSYSKSTCTNSGDITKPTDPTKSGYRFMGWKELTVPTSWKQMIFFPFTSTTPSAYGAGGTTWTVTGNYGSLTGASMCASESGTECWFSSGNGSTCTRKSSPSTSGSIKKECWCRLTSAKFGSITSSYSTTWTYCMYASGSTDACTTGCAYICASKVKDNIGFRRAVCGEVY